MADEWNFIVPSHHGFQTVLIYVLTSPCYNSTHKLCFNHSIFEFEVFEFLHLYNMICEPYYFCCSKRKKRINWKCLLRFWFFSSADRVFLQSWNLSHEDLLQKSDFHLLSKPRDYATLCHLYTILNHLSSSPYPRPSLRNLNSRAIVPLFCGLTLCQKSVYPFASTLWNYLPEDVIQCNSLKSLKSALRAHLG